MTNQKSVKIPIIPPIKIIGDIILKCAAARLTNSGEPAEIINPIILSAKDTQKPLKSKADKCYR